MEGKWALAATTAWYDTGPEASALIWMVKVKWDDLSRRPTGFGEKQILGKIILIKADYYHKCKNATIIK